MNRILTNLAREDNRMAPTGDGIMIGASMIRIVLLLFAFSVTAVTAAASDWPQILGPTRDGKAQNERIAVNWPDGGPKVRWERAVGSGYAGVAVAGSKPVLWHRIGDESVAECLDATSGKAQWKATWPTSYTSSIAPDDGPRCVPVIEGTRVFLVGAEGDLHCVSLSDGKKLWDRNAFAEFNAPLGYFGAGSTPIVEGNLLLMNVGGPKAGIVAFSIDDGSVVWKSTDEDASYSSPIAITIAGRRHAIFVTRLTTISLDPANGMVRWRYPFGARGPTVNAASPIVFDGHLFLSANYGVGARWMRIGNDHLKEVWDNDEVMSSQYTTCIEKDGVFYGIDGRQDQGVARMRAFNPHTREIYWTKEGFGPGNLILAHGKLLVMKIDGTLLLVDPSPKEYRELAKSTVLDTTAQALPALSNGSLFVRDTKTLKCLRIGP